MQRLTTANTKTDYYESHIIPLRVYKARFNKEQLKDEEREFPLS